MEHLGSVVIEHAALASRLEQVEGECLRLVDEVERLTHFVRLAYRDPLTELRNRRYFDRRLADEVALARRSKGRALSLLVLDIDDFKGINDAGGHAMGDAVLRAVALEIQDGLRSHDVCCRIGGDEFGVLLPDTTAATCRSVVARLQAHLERPANTPPQPVRISLGRATFRKADSASDLLRRADRAMYRDKRRRREGAP